MQLHLASSGWVLCQFLSWGATRCECGTSSMSQWTHSLYVTANTTTNLILSRILALEQAGDNPVAVLWQKEPFVGVTVPWTAWTMIPKGPARSGPSRPRRRLQHMVLLSISWTGQSRRQKLQPCALWWSDAWCRCPSSGQDNGGRGGLSCAPSGDIAVADALAVHLLVVWRTLLSSISWTGRLWRLKLCSLR